MFVCPFQSTPRPVVPKPLLYLPHMAQVAAQVLPGLSTSTSALTTTTSSSSLIPVPSVLQSKTLGNDQQQLVSSGSLSDHTSSQTRPLHPQAATAAVGRVTPQVVQAQVIALLQNMLQQQLRNSRQRQDELQTAHAQSQLPVGSSAAAAQLQTIVLSSSAASVARSLALLSAPNFAMAGSPTVSASPTPPPASFPPSTAATTDSTSVDLDQLVEPLLQAPFSAEHPLQTSSDTVNELLRGLCSTTASSTREVEEQNSLQRLSEETADVLPTFAKAVIQMSGNGGRDNVPSSRESMAMPESPPPFDSDEQHKDSSGSSDSLLAFLQGENSGMGTDSNLRQLADQMDFSDVFSQLKDIIRTPEKHRDSLGLKPPAQLGQSQGEGGSGGGWETTASAVGSALNSSSLAHDAESSLSTFLCESVHVQWSWL